MSDSGRPPGGRAASSPVRRRVVVAGGCGGVGRLFATALAAAGDVVAIDLEPAAAEHDAVTVVRGDVTRPDGRVREAVARADAVVLALPEAAAGAAVEAIAGLLRPGSVLADTCSAKRDLLPLLARHAEAAGFDCVSLNPMFAPVLGFAERPVAAVTVRHGPRVDELLGLLRAAGARVVPVAAADYDDIVGAVQVATHAAVLAFGHTVRHSGVPIDTLVALGPPPFQTMLALLGRIVSGQPEVYRAIQATGPVPAKTRAALAAALGDIESASTAGSVAFETLLGDLGAWMGPHRVALADRCAAMFAAGQVTADREG